MKTIAGIAILCVLMGTVAAYSGSEKSVSGLVIFAGVDSIEVKKGKTETTLYWSEGSKVTKNGIEIDRSGVEPCQRVKASYTVTEARNDVVSLEILAGSYCVKE
ncbi:MAG: hypothetical protein E4G96_05685 [Chrysiogenales bacterium]|nr:MAG: hypothetical protein E4G96_05685 [Chrysiogenales bacterium]